MQMIEDHHMMIMMIICILLIRLSSHDQMMTVIMAMLRMRTVEPKDNDEYKDDDGEWR